MLFRNRKTFCWGDIHFLVRGLFHWLLLVGFDTILFIYTDPDSKVHEANMGHIWGRQDPGGHHVGPWTLLSGEVYIFRAISAGAGAVPLSMHNTQGRLKYAYERFDRLNPKRSAWTFSLF